MLNFICSIPENLGWAIVGGLFALCLVALAAVGWIVVQTIKWRIEESKFFAVRHGIIEEDE